jgi:hypothetical protein
MLRTITALLAFVGLLSSTPIFAQINKCVDAAGKTYYSQSPCPPGAKSSTVRSAPPPANAPPPSASGTTGAGSAAAKSTGPKSIAEQEIEFRKRQTEQAEAAKKDQEKATEATQRQENCRNARGSLASLEAGGRQTRFNEKGERYILDDAQTARELDRARQAVDQWCKAS